jgi:hypothetical protein
MCMDVPCPAVMMLMRSGSHDAEEEFADMTDGYSAI